MPNPKIANYEVVEYSTRAEIRSIGFYEIVRRYVGFVHVIGPVLTEANGDRSISASISNNTGTACNLVAVNNDVEKFIRHIVPNKILCLENLIAVPAMDRLSIFYGTIELMPFDLVFGKDAIVTEHGDVESRNDIKIINESE